MVDKKKLLVLDNTTTITSPWKMDVKKYFNYIEAVGGFEAISKLKTMDVSCIIANLSLQAFNGMDAVIKIRERFKKIPIVVIAEKTDVRFVKNVSQYGIHGYFLFPIDVQGLLNTLVKLTGVSIAQIQNAEKTKPGQTGLKQAAKVNNNELDISTLYYEGQSHLLNQDTDKALEVFNRVFSTKKVRDTERRYWEESIFQLGRCLIKKNRLKEAIERMNLFMQRAPNSDLYKQAYFCVGECYETMNDQGRALNIYKKLIDMPPFDSITSKARKKVKVLQK